MKNSKNNRQIRYSHFYPGAGKELAKKIEILINQEKKEAAPAAIPENIEVDMVEGSPLGREEKASIFYPKQKSRVMIISGKTIGTYSGNMESILIPKWCTATDSHHIWI